MTPDLLKILRCPVQRTVLRLEVLEKKPKVYEGKPQEIVWTGILFSEAGFIYPVIGGIPRLIVEAYDDYRDFFRQHLFNYEGIRSGIESKFGNLVRHVQAKNGHTKKAFAQEWTLYDYEDGKTWNLDVQALLDRFLKETDESTESLSGKFVLDAGCGNGHLTIELARAGIPAVGMDFSRSIERAFEINDQPQAYFVQADVEFPPFPAGFFDLVHSSGVLIHTQRTELSFSCLEPCVKAGGKISIWAYQPRKDRIHNLFNVIRKYSSRLPIRIQYYLYLCTLLPVSFLVKRFKGNHQSVKEMMIEILDWFSPRYRWEHEVSEVESWFYKRNYREVKVTDSNVWGFNLVGRKAIHP
jgi:SAM-dependent methyltransferase/uncharacterized protein YbaR (Trm112 family)